MELMPEHILKLEAEQKERRQKIKLLELELKNKDDVKLEKELGGIRASYLDIDKGLDNFYRNYHRNQTGL